MKKLIALTAAVTLTCGLAANSQAQIHISSGFPSHYGHQSRFGHDAYDFHNRNVRHQCDAARLTAAVADLGEVCQHLHADAHELSPGYANSAAIEAYISQLDRLKQHMHQTLSQVTATNSYTSSVDRHIKSDTSEVRLVLTQFYGVVAGQAAIGACAEDMHLLEHMEEIILHEAFPLLGRLESELYGRAQGTLCPTVYSSRYGGYGTVPNAHVHIEQRTSYRPAAAPPVPPVPPFVSRMLSQGGHPAFPPNRSSGYSRSNSTGLQIGNLRIQF